MIRRPPSFRRALLAVVLLAAGWPSRGAAQKKPAMEFTRQGLLILNFAAGTGADARAGRSVADRVRGRAEDLGTSRELEVINATKVRERLVRDGFPADMGLEPAEFAQVSRAVRADEYVIGTVSRGPEGTRVDGTLRLVRSPGTKQPLPPAVGRDADAAAEAFARGILAARAQLVFERRCMNALREGRAPAALDAARQGIAVAPRGVYVRACQVGAMLAGGQPAGTILEAAETLLAIDSTSREGLDGAGRALNALGRRDAAATMWMRLAATDSENVDLAMRVVGGLIDGGNPGRAKGMIARLIGVHPDDITLRRVQWQAAYAARDWELAAMAGDTLLVRDGQAEGDSTLFLKLATAHRTAGHALRAMALVSRAVTQFPKDARLYELYADLVRAERDTVVARGLAAFPNSAALHALEAKDLRGTGKTELALAAMQRAVALDSTLPQGVLTIAQAEFDLGRPDSALASLGRALGRGEDTAAVAQFALAKGNVLLRAATQTQSREDYQRAMRFFVLADTVRSSPQSKFLLGTAALNISKTALTDAPKLADRSASCTLARLGGETLAAARAGLEAGRAIAEDAAKQYLDYASQLAPFAEKQLGLYCDASPATPAPVMAPADTTKRGADAKIPRDS